MQLFAVKLILWTNTVYPEIAIFYKLLATMWFMITTIPNLLPVLLPDVPRSIDDWNVRTSTQGAV